MDELGNKHFIEMAAQWAKSIGKKQAIKRLVIQGVSPTTADKICSGRYHSNPRDLLVAVLKRELARDGDFSDNQNHDTPQANVV